jgi:hypothetical protein
MRLDGAVLAGNTSSNRCVRPCWLRRPGVATPARGDDGQPIALGYAMQHRVGTGDQGKVVARIQPSPAT